MCFADSSSDTVTNEMSSLPCAEVVPCDPVQVHDPYYICVRQIWLVLLFTKMNILLTIIRVTLSYPVPPSRRGAKASLSSLSVRAPPLGDQKTGVDFADGELFASRFCYVTICLFCYVTLYCIWSK